MKKEGIVIAVALILIGAHFWKLSEPIVFWTALEAITVTVSALFIIAQLNALRGDQTERAARGFITFAEKFMPEQFPQDVKMLFRVINLPIDNRAQAYDEFAMNILSRLEVAQAFIDRGLMDREILFLSFNGAFRDAALSFRHLLHAPEKMPWLILQRKRYSGPLGLLRAYETWIAAKEGRPDYND